MITKRIKVAAFTAAAFLAANCFAPAIAAEDDSPKGASVVTEKAAAPAKEDGSPKAAVSAEKTAALAATRTVRHRPAIRVARNDWTPSRICVWLGCNGYNLVGVGF